jgi:SAM-dependent methyltransferase
MALWPAPAGAAPPLDLGAITREVEAFARGDLASWEAGYLEFHRRRYQDTLALLPEGHGRRLLDVGSFPGHLSALAQRRGWEVTGLNNDIEGARPWATFLERCRERKIEILGCDVEREPFPAPTAAFDAVLFCELFEHLYWNPFHTLKEIFRVLRPGGLLVLTTPNWRRAETLFRWLHDWGAQPPVSRPFYALFPSLLYHRHNREYTGSELDYYLARQGKDLYDFRLDGVHYSDCLDDGHEIPGVRGQRVSGIERLAARLLHRCRPRTRGQLMARAVRGGATLVEWSALRGVEGFGTLEEDEQAVQGFTRRLTFPFRRTGPRAALEVPLPPGEGPVLLSLVVAHCAPEDAPPLLTRWSLSGRPAMRLDLPPSMRPVRLRLLVPAGLAARGAVRVELTTTLWRDAVTGREAGLHVGGQWVLAERLGGAPAVAAALERARVERQAEESLDERWWHPAATLQAAGVTRSTVAMGSDDDAQLGPGWFHREDWGKIGRIRWSGPEAVAYLAAPAGTRAVRVRAYSGERGLGPVEGRLVVDDVGAGGAPEPLGERPFSLPADTWADLEVPLAAPVSGPLCLTLHVPAPRVPRDRIPGSRDDRPLGLAVTRLSAD